VTVMPHCRAQYGQCVAADPAGLMPGMLPTTGYRRVAEPLRLNRMVLTAGTAALCTAALCTAALCTAALCTAGSSHPVDCLVEQVCPAR
jgi:hypothetical protein